MNPFEPHASLRKETGAFVAAYAWQNEEGFHISIEYDNPDTRAKHTQSQLLAPDEPSARDFIASKIADFEFRPGDCPIAWKRVG